MGYAKVRPPNRGKHTKKATAETAEGGDPWTTTSVQCFYWFRRCVQQRVSFLAAGEREATPPVLSQPFLGAWNGWDGGHNHNESLVVSKVSIVRAAEYVQFSRAYLPLAR